jgi:hypothetical protein
MDEHPAHAAGRGRGGRGAGFNQTQKDSRKMNRKQLLLILVAGVVLGGIGLYMSLHKSASFERTGKVEAGKLLGDFPVNDVAQVSIRQGSNSVNLAKAETWTVRERADYPANTGEIIEFARRLWDLKAGQSQKVGESQLPRLDLLAPDKAGTNSGTLVELKDKDGKLIRSVLLGKKSMRGGGGDDPFGRGGWPNGRWIYLPERPGTAYLVSETFDQIEPRPEQWLNKDFIRVEKAKSIEATFPVETNSWKLTRETESGEWKLADAKPGEELDSGKAAGVAHPLSSPSFADVSPGNKLEGDGTNAPVIVKIGTFDDFTYTIRVGQKTNENYPLTVAVSAMIPKERTPGADEKAEDKEKLDKEFKERREKLVDKLKKEQRFADWTYLVQSWSVEPLLKERTQFMAEKKEAEKENEATPGAEGTPDEPMSEAPLQPLAPAADE